MSSDCRLEWPVRLFGDQITSSSAERKLVCNSPSGQESF